MTEKGLYDKFVCLFETGSGDLKATIEAATGKISELSAKHKFSAKHLSDKANVATAS